MMIANALCFFFFTGGCGVFNYAAAGFLIKITGDAGNVAGAKLFFFFEQWKIKPVKPQNAVLTLLQCLWISCVCA